MSTHAHKTRKSLLNDMIGKLDRKAAVSSPANEVFRTVSAILALFRDKGIANNDTVQLSDYCFNACEALETAIEERNDDDLDESTRVALEDLGRVTLEIYWTLKRGTSTPQIKYKKGMIEGYKTEIQDILDDLDRPSLPFNGDKAVRSGITQQLCIHSVGGATSVSELGAFERLIRRKFISHELPSLIEEILMCKDVVVTIRYLPRDDAQTFIDVINEALDMPDLSPWAQNQCLRPLYRTCGRHALLPKAMEIPVCYDQTSNALYKGGYADVWKGQYGGKDVAVKVIRIFSNSDFGKVIGRFCKEAITWKTLRHPNVLPLIGVTTTMNQFAMISDWMANGNLNEFVEANPDADRLQLLGDAARGLIYIHERGVVHGDLKGVNLQPERHSPILLYLSIKANILVDQSCRAHLADFGLLTIISDPANLLSSSSYAQGGTARWMSPERISPQDFGLKTSRPSKSSDCYSFGMVIYEIVSGNPPFHRDRDLTVFVKVLKGERPLREEGFADRLWNTLEQCWMPQPSDRPSVEDVFQCLEMCPDQADEGIKGRLGLEGHISPPDEQGVHTLPDNNIPSGLQHSELEFDKKPSSSPPTDKKNTPPAPSPFPLLEVADAFSLAQFTESSDPSSLGGRDFINYQGFIDPQAINNPNSDSTASSSTPLQTVSYDDLIQSFHYDEEGGCDSTGYYDEEGGYDSTGYYASSSNPSSITTLRSKPLESPVGSWNHALLPPDEPSSPSETPLLVTLETSRRGAQEVQSIYSTSPPVPGTSRLSGGTSDSNSRPGKGVNEEAGPSVMVCRNCQSMDTPIWRIDPEGKPLCNACGLFYKLHGVVRPLSLKTDVIKKRNRTNGRRVTFVTRKGPLSSKVAPST